MARRRTGRGRFRTVEDSPDLVAGLLYNFDFDWSEPKAEHRIWLHEHPARLLNISGGGSVELKGLASRIGDCEYNRRLSERRARAVWNYLRGAVNSRHYVSVTVDALGEREAAARGIADETETSEGLYRGVFVAARPVRYPSIESLTRVRERLSQDQNERIGALMVEKERLERELRRLERVRFQNQQTAIDYGSTRWERAPHHRPSNVAETVAESPLFQGPPIPGETAQSNWHKATTRRELEEAVDRYSADIERLSRRIEAIGRQINDIRTEALQERP